jgi:hypothetical protein
MNKLLVFDSIEDSLNLGDDNHASLCKRLDKETYLRLLRKFFGVVNNRTTQKSVNLGRRKENLYSTSDTRKDLTSYIILETAS